MGHTTAYSDLRTICLLLNPDHRVSSHTVCSSATNGSSSTELNQGWDGYLGPHRAKWCPGASEISRTRAILRYHLADRVKVGRIE